MKTYIKWLKKQTLKELSKKGYILNININKLIKNYLN